MSGTRFVVVRHHWRRLPGGGFVRLPGAYPLLGFDTFDEAEAIRDHREREVRERVNPFACGPSFFPLTHFAPHAFADWLRDVGLEPPEPDAPMPDWQTWWREVRPDMSVEQIQRCWQGLDKLRFFVVREVPDRPPVHVLLGIHWDNWEWTFVAEHEGGLPIAAYRDREVAGRAEAELREARVAEFEEWDRFEHVPRWFDADPFTGNAAEVPRREADRNQVPFAEVAPVLVHGDAAAVARAKSIWVVVRLTYRLATDPVLTLTRVEGGTIGVPVAAYLSADEAWAAAWKRDEEAHPFLNPFWFGPPGLWVTRELEEPSITAAGFLSFLTAQGLGPVLPEEELNWWTPTEWVPWWDAIAPVLSPEQRTSVWAVLERLRLHEVVEVPLE
ncbi:MAG TPA: hypothetical protein VKE74_20315 [Gemmataceae bacterium]|nr:hypothetical protein [Gemmataceae bacterium]